ncbi:hypothetical protein CDAR_462851 [Caerostris darwini]|uniref:Uncharacterized protein n=1 Tax=Caerostris darwini TaxID=1538125 RepID=A0AAV4QXY5_9ARAC|nr:hypothetical protein CDAR_462851 [Caerostris darwini]
MMKYAQTRLTDKFVDKILNFENTKLFLKLKADLMIFQSARTYNTSSCIDTEHELLSSLKLIPKIIRGAHKSSSDTPGHQITGSKTDGISHRLLNTDKCMIQPYV